MRSARMSGVQDSHVKKFWETRAQDQSLTDAEATHNDVWQRWLEIETIDRKSVV